MTVLDRYDRLLILFIAIFAVLTISTEHFVFLTEKTVNYLRLLSSVISIGSTIMIIAKLYYFRSATDQFNKTLNSLSINSLNSLFETVVKVASQGDPLSVEDIRRGRELIVKAKRDGGLINREINELRQIMEKGLEEAHYRGLGFRFAMEFILNRIVKPEY